jgi:hypothetical protein
MTSAAALLRLEKERETQKKELFNFDPSYRVIIPSKNQKHFISDSKETKAEKYYYLLCKFTITE